MHSFYQAQLVLGKLQLLGFALSRTPAPEDGIASATGN
jgi:hypothetical protein